MQIWEAVRANEIEELRRLLRSASPDDLIYEQEEKEGVHI